MVLKRIYTFQGAESYLKGSKKLCIALGLKSVPSRTTLSRRTKTIHKKMREMIRSVGGYFSRLYSEGFLGSAMDSSLFESKGGVWHKSYRKIGITPSGLKGVDRESEWGYSKYRGWIQGYKGHFNVAFGENDEIFPVDACVTKGNVADVKKGKTLTEGLDRGIKIQLADKGYCDRKLFWKLLFKNRLLVTPIKKNRIRKGLQEKLYRFIRRRGLYQKRGETVERFIGHLKDLFLIDPLPVKGKNKVRVLILGSVLAYQILGLYNEKSHRKLNQIKELLNKC